ncbi:MAG: ABC transporter substrate-binding protein [Alphaproteobacteria bacterium]|nr:ABC transporter substrate-binding protein [Alphaproteobacteria bacterium]
MFRSLYKIHAFLPELFDQFVQGQVTRRDFLRYSTLLGLSASSAFSLIGCDDDNKEQNAQSNQEQPQSTIPEQIKPGGKVTIGMRLPNIDSPHNFGWSYSANVVRQVCDYLTRTGSDNITKPWLLEKWQASDDLKRWTFTLRSGITWSNGDSLTVEQVIWNIKRWLDPRINSPMMALMKNYLLEDVATGIKTAKGQDLRETRLWSQSAIEQIDEKSFRINCHNPQIAIPEHFFHFTALILHPSENGKFGVGSLGTGPFILREFVKEKYALLVKREDYWHHKVMLDEVEFIDFGDDAAKPIAAIAGEKIDGLHEASTTQYVALERLNQLEFYQIPSAQTAVVRMQPIHAEWHDMRVRKALKLALDNQKILQISHLGLGLVGEHHHVSLLHSDYAKLPPIQPNIAKAKELLAEAGFPNGFSTEIVCKKDPDWELIAVQAMSQMWHEIGVDVRINVVSSSQYWESWKSDSIPFAFTSWTHFPFGTMALDLAYGTGSPWNESYYSNPVFDELLLKAGSIFDPKARSGVMAELEYIMQEEGPICQPLWRTLFTVMHKRIGGFILHPSGYIFAEDLWIQP